MTQMRNISIRGFRNLMKRVPVKIQSRNLANFSFGHYVMIPPDAKGQIHLYKSLHEMDKPLKIIHYTHKNNNGYNYNTNNTKSNYSKSKTKQILIREIYELGMISMFMAIFYTVSFLNSDSETSFPWLHFSNSNEKFPPELVNTLEHILDPNIIAGSQSRR